MKTPFIRDVVELMSIRSTSTRPQELQRAAAWIENTYAEQAQIKTRTYMHAGVPSVYAQTRGRFLKPDILLHGHFDVVEGMDSDFVPRVTRDRIYGRGAADMKAAVVIMMHTLIAAAQKSSGPSIGLLLTGDEEIGGKHGSQWLIERAHIRPRCVVNLDGGYGEAISYAEKGIVYAHIVARGKSSLATYPWNGECAFSKITEAARILGEHFSAQYRASNEDNWVDTCTIMHAQGGTLGVKRVIDHAEMTARIAFTRDITAEQMLKEVQELLPACTVTSTLNAERVYTHPEHPVVEQFKNIYTQELGHDIALRGDNGSSDARFFSQLNIPIILTKPKSGNPEMDNEWVDINSCTRLLQTLTRFCAEYKNTH